MSERAMDAGVSQSIAFQEPDLARAQEAAERRARFAALVERQSRFAFQVAYAVLRNSHDAEDAAQEAFLKLYRGSAWEAIEDERAFLARTVWRVAVDRRGKPSGEPLDPNMTYAGESPEASAAQSDQDAMVHRLIDGLPEELRLPLALSAVEEMTSSQIAETIGIAEGTVRTRIMRARQILKQKLANMREARDGKRRP